MKKLIWIFPFLLIVSLAFAECPAPFEKAKEYALTAPLDEYKVHMVTLVKGDLVICFGTDPKTGEVWIASNFPGQPVIVTHYPKEDIFIAETKAGKIQVPKEKAIEFGFQVMRLAVSNGLLK